MTTPDGRPLESLLLANLALIERIVAAIARRHRLDVETAADFDSFAKMRLIENDYAILRKFRGESTLPTYLTVVVAMLFREYRVRQWGRWRPSAAALRAGPLAVRLETLIYRDGCRFDEAAHILRSSGEWQGTDRELAALYSDLPNRAPVRPAEVPADLLTEAGADRWADDLVEAGELDAQRAAAERSLRRALLSLAPEDALIVRMRFWEGMPVADIGRALALPAKPLYRRLERAVGRMRRMLEADGVSSDRAREILDRAAS